MKEVAMMVMRTMEREAMAVKVCKLIHTKTYLRK